MIFVFVTIVSDVRHFQSIWTWKLTLSHFAHRLIWHEELYWCWQRVTSIHLNRSLRYVNRRTIRFTHHLVSQKFLIDTLLDLRVCGSNYSLHSVDDAKTKHGKGYLVLVFSCCAYSVVPIEENLASYLNPWDQIPIDHPKAQTWSILSGMYTSNNQAIICVL